MLLKKGYGKEMLILEHRQFAEYQAQQTDFDERMKTDSPQIYELEHLLHLHLDWLGVRI
jgi:hypothetical protein